jgi:hypothetical protein
MFAIKILSHGERVDLNSFDLLREFFASGKNQYAFLPKNFAAIDFAGPGREVFQLTTGTRHQLNAEKTKSLLEAAGLLGRNNKGDLVIGPSPQPLQCYWVVVEPKYQEVWSKKKPYYFRSCPESKPQKERAEKEILKTCWSLYVEQYVLVIPRIAPFPLSRK